MSLLDEAAAIEADAPTRCKLTKMIGEHPPAMQDEMWALVWSGHPGPVVVQVLAKYGVNTSSSTVVGHRRGVCRSCGTPS